MISRGQVNEVSGKDASLVSINFENTLYLNFCWSHQNIGPTKVNFVHSCNHFIEFYFADCSAFERMSVPQRELFKFGRRGEEEKVELKTFIIPRPALSSGCQRLFGKAQSPAWSTFSRQSSPNSVCCIRSRPSPAPTQAFTLHTWHSTHQKALLQARFLCLLC